MSIDDLKKAIIAEVNSCEDEGVLLKLLTQLNPSRISSKKNNKVKGPEIIYGGTANAKALEEHYALLVEDRKKVAAGVLEGKPWSEIYTRLRDEE